MLGSHRSSAAGKAGRQGKRPAAKNVSSRQANIISAVKASQEYNAALTAAAVAAAKAAIESPSNVTTTTTSSSGPSTAIGLRRNAPGNNSNTNAPIVGTTTSSSCHAVGGGGSNVERRPSRSSTVLSAAPHPPSPSSSSTTIQQQQQYQHGSTMNASSTAKTRIPGDDSTTQSLATSVNLPPSSMTTSDTTPAVAITTAATGQQSDNTNKGMLNAVTAPRVESPLARPHRSELKPRDGISVVVRVRPLTIAEHADPSARNCVQCLKDYVIIGGVNGSATSSGVLTARTSEDKLKLSATKPAPTLRPCQFGVDQVLHPHTTQIEVYERTCRDIVAGVFEGINGAILAYGATGSGKTHTMFGSALSAAGIVYQSIQDIFAEKRRLEEEEGCTVTVRCSFVEIYNEEVYDLLVTPRRSGQNNPLAGTMNNSPQQQQQHQANSGSSPTKTFMTSGNTNSNTTSGSSSTSNHNPVNGTSPRKRSNTATTRMGMRGGAKGGGLAGRTALQVRENVADDASVNPESLNISNLTYAYPDSLEAFSRAIEVGHANRFTAATGANSESSRSHAIITVEVRVQPTLDAVTDLPPVTSNTVAANEANRERPAQGTLARIQFCDLAGSERAASTSNTGIRLREGGNINRSLLALGAVVQSLVQRRRYPEKQIFVPYRGSKLTRLLRDGLSGNCRTQIIFCLSPCNHQYEESLNTMLFAMQAKEVQIAARRNVFTVNTAQVAQNQERLIEELRAELYAAQQELARLGGNVPTAGGLVSGTAAHGVVEARLSACSASGGVGVNGFERGQSPVLVSVEGSAVPAIISARGTRPVTTMMTTCPLTPTAPPPHTSTITSVTHAIAASPRLRDVSIATSPAESTGVAMTTGGAQPAVGNIVSSTSSTPLGPNNTNNTGVGASSHPSLATLGLQKAASIRGMLSGGNMTTTTTTGGGGATASRASRASVFTEGRLCFTELEDKLKNYTQQKDTLYRQMRDAQEQRSERDIVLRQYKWKLARFLASNALAGNKAGRSGDFANAELRTEAEERRDSHANDDERETDNTSHALTTTMEAGSGQRSAPNSTVGVAGLRNVIATMEAEGQALDEQLELLNTQLNRVDRELADMLKELVREKQPASLELLLDNTKLRHNCTEAECLAAHFHQESRVAQNTSGEYAQALEMCVGALRAVLPHLVPRSAVQDEVRRALLYAPLPALPTTEMITSFESALRAESTPPLAPPLVANNSNNITSDNGSSSPGTALFFSPRHSRTTLPMTASDVEGNAASDMISGTTNTAAAPSSSSLLLDAQRLPRSFSPRHASDNNNNESMHGPMRRHYYHHHNSHRGEGRLDGTAHHLSPQEGLSPAEMTSYQQAQELSAEMMTLEQHFRELTRDVAQSEATARARRAAMRGANFASARPRRGDASSLLLSPLHARPPGLYDTSQTCRASLGREGNTKSIISGNDDDNIIVEDKTRAFTRLNAETKAGSPETITLHEAQHTHQATTSNAVLPHSSATLVAHGKDTSVSARLPQTSNDQTITTALKAVPHGKTGNTAVSARQANSKRTVKINNTPLQDGKSTRADQQQQRRQLYNVFGNAAANAKSSRGNGKDGEKSQGVPTRRRTSLTNTNNTTTTTTPAAMNTSLIMGASSSSKKAATRTGGRRRAGGEPVARSGPTNNTNNNTAPRHSPTNNSPLISPRAAATTNNAKNVTRAPRVHRNHHTTEAALPAPLPFRRLHTDASEGLSRAAASQHGKLPHNHGTINSNAMSSAMTMNRAWASIVSEDIRRGHSPTLAQGGTSNSKNNAQQRARFTRSNSLPYTSHGLLNTTSDAAVDEESVAGPAMQPFTRTQAMTLLGTPSKAPPHQQDETSPPLHIAADMERHISMESEAQKMTDSHNNLHSPTTTTTSEPSPSHPGTHRRTSVVTKVPPTSTVAALDATRLDNEHGSRETSEAQNEAPSLSSTIISPLANTTNTLGATMTGASTSTTATMTVASTAVGGPIESSPLTRTTRAISRGASSTSVGLDCVSVSSSSTDASVTTSVHRVVRSSKPRDNNENDEKKKKSGAHGSRGGSEAGNNNSGRSRRQAASKGRHDTSASAPSTTITTKTTSSGGAGSNNTVTNDAPSLIAQSSRRRGVVTKTPTSAAVTGVSHAGPVKLVAMPTEDEDGCSTRSLSDNAPSSDPAQTTTTTTTTTAASSVETSGERSSGGSTSAAPRRGGGVVASLRQMFSKVKNAPAATMIDGKENHVT